jgi:hypothetical protein
VALDVDVVEDPGPEPPSRGRDELGPQHPFVVVPARRGAGDRDADRSRLRLEHLAPQPCERERAPSSIIIVTSRSGSAPSRRA